MSIESETTASSEVQRAGGTMDERLFWLARLDPDLPRAGVVPDRRRAACDGRRASVAFEVPPQITAALRSPNRRLALSDPELCMALVSILMWQHQREDLVLAGLRCTALFGDAGPVLPIHLPCGADDTFVSAAQDIRSQVAQMSRRSTAAMVEVAPTPVPGGDGARRTTYDLLVVVGTANEAPDPVAHGVDVAIEFETAGGRLRGRIAYAEALYEPGTIERLARQLARAAEAAARAPDSALRHITLMSQQEQAQVLRDFNQRSAAYPLEQTFHSLFEAQARRTPQAGAVVHRQARLSYEELNTCANRLAHTLLAQGLTKGAFVGILLHRGCDFAVAMLAVFKAGGAYVPLDPTYPAERVAYMLDDSEAAFVVTDAVLAAQYGAMFAGCARLRVVASTAGRLDGVAALPAVRRLQPEQIGAAPAHDPGLALGGRDRAYMIYTSGSTGRPKGAICRHDGALNHLFGELDGIGVRGAFHFLQTAASSSDISVWQFMAPLLHGGTCVVADYEAVVDPPVLLALMRDERVSVAEPVPVVLRALLDHLAALPADARALPDLACMMCTGEALPGELVDRWLALYPQIPIANTYGPTETSDDVTLLVLREPIGARFAVTPIGPPLPNVRIFVLDRALRALPVGVPGELCIGGVAVGEGYWRQPEKTAAAFVPCPFPEVAAGPMYRTGDLARWLEDGSIEFLGRIDQQVKVRGFRIEPGEIEGVLNTHPAVQDAAVVAVADAAGNRRLVGHYVAREGMATTPAELRQFLKGKLAEHMVPSLLLPLRALPLTPLGKVDRRALARIEAPAADDSGAGRAAPRDATERMLCALWARVTGAAQVGIHDNFFEIGGDSILSIQVVAALREQGYAVAPRQIFRNPTVAELAAQLAAPGTSGAPGAEGGAPQDKARRAAAEQSWEVARWREALAPLYPELEDVFPLSATQRGIYFQSLLAPRTSGAYVEQIAFDLVGALDEAAFGAAWQHATDAIVALRTAIIRRGAPFPLQAVVRGATLTPSFLDLRELAPERQQQRLAALVTEDRMKGFDLKRPPLARVTLVRLGTERWRVLWAYHHLILDGWAEPMVLGAVFRAYDALRAGRAPRTEAGLPYREFVLWSEAQDHTAAESFWRDQLAGFTSPVTITDTSPAVTPPSGGEISHGWEHARLAAAPMQALELAARRTGLTLGTV
ncbi:MAG: amino acid adenylation domain-containing protein, partial [Burkholderiales bacterium]|nr:amino acid adenylation domain-containing protein [Burkholderiales bacterium]